MLEEKDDIFKFNGIRTNTNELQNLYQNILKLNEVSCCKKKGH